MRTFGGGFENNFEGIHAREMRVDGAYRSIELGIVPQNVTALDRVADLNLGIGVVGPHRHKHHDNRSDAGRLTHHDPGNSLECLFLHKVNAGFLIFAANNAIDVLRNRHIGQDDRDHESTGRDDP